MKVRRHSKSYNFIGDTKSGLTFRWGSTFQENPIRAPWPELADISISNHCTKGCEFCYRDSTANNSFMSPEEYENILNELTHTKWGNVFQIAIGGGEPLEHPQIKEIIATTLSYNVVPNLTTNGIHLSKDFIDFINGKVGAIAISTFDIQALNYRGIELLKDSSMKTNIHYVLSKRNISQATKILYGEHNDALKGLNSIIFLSHKPHGRANSKDTLELNDDLKTFVKKIDSNKCSTRIGFDACFVPHLLHFTEVEIEYIDACECGFFSIYIDEKLNVTPCSFDNNHNYTFSLKEHSFADIWENQLQDYRNTVINACQRQCKNTDECRGACPYYSKITCCYSKTPKEALYV